MSGLVPHLLRPTLGIVAGSTFATTGLRCLLLDSVMEHSRANPLVRLNIFVDDVTLDITTSDKFTTARTLFKAGNDHAHSFEQCLGLRFAGDKSAVLSNSAATANLIRRGFKGLGGKALKSV